MDKKLLSELKTSFKCFPLKVLCSEIYLSEVLKVFFLVTIIETKMQKQLILIKKNIKGHIIMFACFFLIPCQFFFFCYCHGKKHA